VENCSDIRGLSKLRKSILNITFLLFSFFCFSFHLSKIPDFLSYFDILWFINFTYFPPVIIFLFHFSSLLLVLPLFLFFTTIQMKRSQIVLRFAKFLGAIAVIGFIAGFLYIIQVNRVINRYNKFNFFEEVMSAKYLVDFLESETRTNPRDRMLRGLSREIESDKSLSFKDDRNSPGYKNVERYFFIKFNLFWRYFFAIILFWFFSFYLEMKILDEKE